MTRQNKFPQMAWSPAHIERFWEYESQFPENYYSFKFGPQILNRAAEALGGRAADWLDKTWLDYGCGYGSFTEHLLAVGVRVVIHDSSGPSLESCARRCSRYPNFLGVLDAVDEPIHVVSLLEVIEHVDVDAMRQIITSLRNRCGSGARLVITTPNDEDLSAYSNIVYCPQCDTVRHRWQHLRSFTAASLRQELIDAGLTHVRVVTHNFRRDKRFATRNPLRLLKRVIVDFREFTDRQAPNLLAVAQL